MFVCDRLQGIKQFTTTGTFLGLTGSTGQPPPNNNPPPTITPAVLAEIQDLVAQANLHYKAAYAALAKGDLATFANEMAQVGQILAQLQALTGGTTGTSPSPSPSPWTAAPTGSSSAAPT